MFVIAALATGLLLLTAGVFLTVLGFFHGIETLATAHAAAINSGKRLADVSPDPDYRSQSITMMSIGLLSTILGVIVLIVVFLG